MCTCRKRIIKIRRWPSFSRKAAAWFPTERGELSSPGTRAPRGTLSGNIPRPSVSHHSQVKKKKKNPTSRKPCELLLTKNSNNGGRNPKPRSAHHMPSHTVSAVRHIIDGRFLQEGDILLQLTVCFYVFGRTANPIQASIEAKAIFISHLAWTDVARGGDVALHVGHTEPQWVGSEKVILMLRNRTGTSRKKWRCRRWGFIW